MNPNAGALSDIKVHPNTMGAGHVFRGSHFDGPRAKRTPDWEDCGGGMIAHVKWPNMRLRLVGGVWRSVANPSSRSQIGKKEKKDV